jgi:cold shock CspA family protein
MDAEILTGERQIGTICRWLEPRNFGFISQGAGKTFERFFFHQRAFKSDGIPVVGARVSFVVNPVQEGPCRTAEQVVVIS